MSQNYDSKMESFKLDTGEHDWQFYNEPAFVIWNELRKFAQAKRMTSNIDFPR